MSAVSSKELGGLWRFKDRKYRDLGHPLAVILMAFAIFLISQFLAAIIAGVGYAIINPTASLTDALSSSAPLQFAYVGMAEGLAIGLTIFVVRKIRHLSLEAIGLGRRPQWRDLTRALLGALIFYGLLVVAVTIIGIFAPSLNANQKQEVGFDTLNSSLDGILAFTALVLFPPIGEETLVRGYLYSGLRARWRFLPAMLITSLLFGVAHVTSGADSQVLWIAGVDTFLLSVVLIYLRERTGALYAGMLVHATNNAIAFSVHFHGLILLPR
jgi:membrane protease YdiL (CAAX protease family)